MKNLISYPGTNRYSVQFGVFLLVIVFACLGCSVADPVPLTTRKVEFELFTDEDLSQETGKIIFQSRILSGKTTLWDSTFAPMYIKDIPNAANAIVFDKVVIADVRSELKVGFRYTIEHVGISWYYEHVPPGVSVKTLAFNFQ